jgi:hypothetical protein
MQGMHDVVSVLCPSDGLWIGRRPSLSCFSSQNREGNHHRIRAGQARRHLVRLEIATQVRVVSNRSLSISESA